MTPTWESREWSVDYSPPVTTAQLREWGRTQQIRVKEKFVSFLEDFLGNLRKLTQTFAHSNV